jgi:hypothetical protein
MSADHDELRELLGAYLLGGLEAEDRFRLDAHLRTCEQCRDELVTYAGLPALLRHGAPAVEAAPEPDNGRLVAALDTLRAARRRQRRRLVLLGAAAAVVLLSVGGIVTTLFAVGTDPDGGSSTRFVAARTSGAQGEARLVEKGWGTEVGLELSGLPTGENFVAWVVAEDGTREQACNWGSTPTGGAVVSGASAIARTRVTEVQVTTAGGTVLLTADV